MRFEAATEERLASLKNEFIAVFNNAIEETR
jgi:hypothetical protein